MSPERLALRAAIDRAVRERVERENEHLKLCAGGGMPRSDWTPGCRTCFARHNNYATGKNRSPYPLDSTLRARVQICALQLSIDRGRIGLAEGTRRRWAA